MHTTPGAHDPARCGARAAAEGRCLCGAVRYRAGGPLSLMLHCHCSICRKHHGSAFATFIAAPLMSFRWISGEDRLQSYQSSEKGRRSFCATCGAVAPLLATQMDMALLPAGNLDGDPGVRPQGHIFVGSKAPWYTIPDRLPQHEEYPPEFGAAGVERPVLAHCEGAVGGSCLCGDVAYEATGPALRMVNCHCTRCRRARSAAHATNVAYRIGDFRFTRGAGQVRTYKAAEARSFTVAFCARCGGGAPHTSKERNLAFVPAGSLDSDPGVRPEGHIFVGSKAAWFEIADRLPQFAEAAP